MALSSLAERASMNEKKFHFNYHGWALSLGAGLGWSMIPGEYHTQQYGVVLALALSVVASVGNRWY